MALSISIDDYQCYHCHYSVFTNVIVEIVPLTFQHCYSIVTTTVIVIVGAIVSLSSISKVVKPIPYLTNPKLRKLLNTFTMIRSALVSSS